MKPLFQLLIMILVINPFLHSQAKQVDINPWPKFVPYLFEKNNSEQNYLDVDIYDLGKEQPTRWLSVDPLADKYPGWSPYNYTINNPLINVDPDGKEVKVKTEDDAKRFINDVNYVYAGAPVSYNKVTEEHSFLGIFSWTTEHYVITADGGGSFDWSQDQYASGLYDAIATTENVFSVNYVDPGTKVGYYGDITKYGGGRFNSWAFGGGGDVYLQKSGSNYGDPRAVVMMHEIIGHGHPTGGNDATAVNRFYMDKLNYGRTEPLSPHGGYYPYHSGRIKWNKINLFNK